MKHVLANAPLLVPLLVILGGCPAVSVTSPTAYTAPESLILKFDSRPWALANKQSKPGYTLTEYLLPGQTPSTFTESLGATYVSYETGARLETEAERLRNGVTAACPGASWETVTQRPSELTYVWSVRGCASQPDQYEIGRFVATSTGVHRVAYVIKTDRLDPASRLRWLDLLAQAQVAANRPSP